MQNKTILKTSPRSFRRYLVGLVTGLFPTAGLLLAASMTMTGAPAAPPSDNPLPDGVLAWDSLAKETNAVVDAGPAHFFFSVTNVSHRSVTILEVLPSCGCTTAQTPPSPWVIPAGGSGQFGLTVNLLGKARNQIKQAMVRTDAGFKIVSVTINVLPPVVPSQSAADRLRSLTAAQADRQAIFRADCAACHVKPGAGKDGRALYYAVCAVCHEGRDHALPAPDLFAIKTPTNVVFWLDWIAHGKPGTLMPAFSTADGGPLSDLQIAYLARFLNTTDNMDPPADPPENNDPVPARPNPDEDKNSRP